MTLNSKDHNHKNTNTNTNSTSKRQKNTKPRHLKRAAALRYNPEINQAPEIIASGQGLVAEEIIRRAEEQGIHVHENPELAETLSRLSLYQEIPEELYQAIAEVLAFVQTLERKSRDSQ